MPPIGGVLHCGTAGEQFALPIQASAPAADAPQGEVCPLHTGCLGGSNAETRFCGSQSFPRKQFIYIAPVFFFHSQHFWYRRPSRFAICGNFRLNEDQCCGIHGCILACLGIIHLQTFDAARPVLWDSWSNLGMSWYHLQTLWIRTAGFHNPCWCIAFCDDNFWFKIKTIHGCKSIQRHLRRAQSKQFMVARASKGICEGPTGKRSTERHSVPTDTSSQPLMYAPSIPGNSRPMSLGSMGTNSWESWS